MAFTTSIPEIVPTKRPGRTKKATLTVWEDTVARMTEQLRQSKEEALGRWGGVDATGEEVKAQPLPDAVKAPNWAVKKADEFDCANDEVSVSVKIGSKLYNTFGDGKTHYNCQGSDVHDLCGQLIDWVGGLDKDSGDGKSIHALSIKAKEVRAKMAYNSATDKFDLEK